MTDKFLAFVKANKLIEGGDRILLGISGGIDSATLLDLLLKSRDKLKIEISLAHLNYGLRKESDSDHRFVKDLAAKNNLQLFERKVKLSGGNIEEKARDARYNFFNAIASKNGIDKVAVAHHKNDLAETMLLNLVRGSGIDGLASMQPKAGNLIRPLLFATRKEIENYAVKSKLAFVEDKTNKDIALSRNLLRRKVIPELEKINPKFIETMAGESNLLRQVADFQEKLAGEAFGKLAKKKGGMIELSAKELSALDPYLQSLIFRKTILNARGDLKDISSKNILDLMRLCRTSSGTKSLSLPLGLKATRIYDRIVLAPKQKSLSKPHRKVRLEFGKKENFGAWQLFLEKSEKSQPVSGISLVRINIEKTGKLLVRSRQAGDRIAINKNKTKKIQDIFTDAKIPRQERDAYPIVVNEKNEVVWVPHLRLSSAFKADEKTQNIATIEATKEK